MVAHCLLIETPLGLVLVDSGFGLEDCRKPALRLGRSFRGFVRPRLDERETAIRQIERLGFQADDVRHVILTHLDLDHAGGISDFPHARVHVYRPEHEAAMQRRTAHERQRYRPIQWAHHPHWAVHEAPGGERWNGFEAIHALDDRLPDVLLIPLIGHTRGHCGVAVQQGEDAGGGWLVHAGDAYFHHGEIEPRGPHCPAGLGIFQKMMSIDEQMRIQNQARLRTLAAQPGVRVFCSHDPAELQREVAFFNTP